MILRTQQMLCTDTRTSFFVVWG